jgi:predicted nucleic acid-binding protein
MIVLDASALVDVVLGHPDSAWSLDRMGAEDVCAPAHQMAEVLSALARLRRAGVIDGAGAMTALAEAAAFPQEVLAPTERHLHRALELSEGIRVLDGLYVALAEERSCPLVTTDRRLAHSGAPCEVLAPPS